jgi:hypothetical protein
MSIVQIMETIILWNMPGGYRPLCPFGNFGLLTCCITNYPSTMANLGQITLFLQMLKFSKDIFLKEHIFVKG